MVDNFKSAPERTVWENTNGTKLLTVTGLLKPGKYKVVKTVNDEGNTTLEFKAVEDS